MYRLRLLHFKVSDGLYGRKRGRLPGSGLFHVLKWRSARVGRNGVAVPNADIIQAKACEEEYHVAGEADNSDMKVTGAKRQGRNMKVSVG